MKQVLLITFAVIINSVIARAQQTTVVIGNVKDTGSQGVFKWGNDFSHRHS